MNIEIHLCYFFKSNNAGILDLFNPESPNNILFFIYYWYKYLFTLFMYHNYLIGMIHHIVNGEFEWTIIMSLNIIVNKQHQ
jgi:hypothetical protein